MKGLLKLFPVAAAAFALASCSSDDLFGNWTSQDEGGLKVAVEDLMEEGMTRQANIRQESNKIDWQKKDLLNVYDKTLTIYDIYEYDGTIFKGANDGGESYFTEGTEPVYALFPADRVERTSWSPTGTKAIIQIPEYITYDNHSEYRAESGNVAYVSNLPMYGTVADGSSYEDASASLYYLTSVLRINITNAFADKVTWLKIETQDNQPISGYFETTLTTEGSEKSVLQPSANQMLTTSNAMYVDLRKVPSYMTYLYLPIIAGTYDWMKVSVTDEKDVPQSDVKNLDADKWTVIRNWEAGVTFTRAVVKPFSTETQYDLGEVTTVELLNKALQQYADYDREASEAGADVVLNIGTKNNGLEVMNTGTTNTNDFTIQMPEMSAEHVTINIAGGLIPADENQTLNIVNADDDYPFTGTLTINAAGVKNNDMKLFVNLKDFNGNPTANVQLVGDLKNDGKNKKGLSDITIEKAINVVFGDGSTTTNIAPTTLTVKQAKTVTIAGKASVEAELDVMETKDIESVTIEKDGKINKLIRSFEATVNVNGTAQNIYVYSSKGVVNVGDGATASGKTTNIYTIGDVNIANAEESEAVTGTLSVLGNNTINLKQGYIYKIDYALADKFNEEGAYKVKKLTDLNASDLQNKHITINLHEIVGEGLTAIASISNDLLNKGQYVFVELTTSKWGGAKINGDKFPKYVTDAALQKIYTASELASITRTDETKDIVKNLYNNIDLKVSPNGTSGYWSSPNKKGTKVNELPTLNDTFDGQDPRFGKANAAHAARLNADTNDGRHTITGMTFGMSIAGGQAHGLFGKIDDKTTYEHSVKNLIITGVSVDADNIDNTQTTEGFGVVAAEVSLGNREANEAQTISFENITVEGGAFGQLKSNNKTGGANIGGIVGKVATGGNGDLGEVTFTKCSVTLESIKGYYNLGGVVGGVGAGTVTINNDCEVEITNGFNITHNGSATDEIDENYGRVGVFVGSVNSNAEIYVPSAAKDIIKGHRGNAVGIDSYSELGFPYNFAINQNIKYFYYGGKAEVGYSTVGTIYIWNAASAQYETMTLTKKYETSYDVVERKAFAQKFNVFVRQNYWDAAK